MNNAELYNQCYGRSLIRGRATCIAYIDVLLIANLVLLWTLHYTNTNLAGKNLLYNLALVLYDLPLVAEFFNSPPPPKKLYDMPFVYLYFSPKALTPRSPYSLRRKVQKLRERSLESPHTLSL
jgi:hypothetical protein